MSFCLRAAFCFRAAEASRFEDGKAGGAVVCSETAGASSCDEGWAIGDAGMPATVDQVSLNVDTIKNVTNDLLKREIPCLYGGSVNAENCEQFAKCKNLDGLFIGRAAWDVQNFVHIIHLCQRVV